MGTMSQAELMMGIVIGGLLIDLGLRPGEFQRFVDRIRNLHLSNSDGIDLSPLAYSPATGREAPVWLAVLGVALIALTVVGVIIDCC
jgi:hypothetical protein